MKKTTIIFLTLVFTIILIGCNNTQKENNNNDQNQNNSLNNVFSQTGNIVKQNNNRTLIYDTPGSPATTQNLLFEVNPSINIGDRVFVSGKIINDMVIVEKLEIIEKHKEPIEKPSIKQNTEKSVHNFESCKEAGYEILYPDCIDCKPYCETPDGKKFSIN